MAEVLLSTAKTRLQNDLKDISDVTDAIFVSWCQNITEFIYRKISKVDPERFITSSTVTITAGTNSYALPSDFKHIEVLGTGLYAPDTDGNETDRRWTKTEFGSRITGYYISGSNVVFTPDDYPVGDTATLRYIPNIATYTATTDYFTVNGNTGGVIIVDSEYLEFLTRALEVQYFIWDEDPSSESFSDMRYIRALNELLDNIRRTPGAVIMPDMSEIY